MNKGNDMNYTGNEQLKDSEQRNNCIDVYFFLVKINC